MPSIDLKSEFPQTAKGHCELMAEAHRRLESTMIPVEVFLLEHGEEFEANPRPDWVPQMTVKMCFANCFKLAMENQDKLAYCEGYVLSSDLPIPIHHAWCVEEDGTLIEPTIGDKAEGETITYFGVKVPDFNDVFDVIEETGTYSILFKRFGHEMIERRNGDGEPG